MKGIYIHIALTSIDLNKIKGLTKMKKVFIILKSHEGETLVETIVTTLLIAIAFTVLTMMITLAGNLNRSASEVSRSIANDTKALATVEKTPTNLTFTDNIPLSGFQSNHNVICDVQRIGKFTLYSVK